MNEAELQAWIRYQDARIGGFKKWAVEQLQTDEGRTFIGQTLRPFSLEDAQKATDELFDREEQPRGLTAAFRTIRFILRRREGNRREKPRKDPILMECNFPAWLGYSKRAVSEKESIREAIEYWELWWKHKSKGNKHELQDTMAKTWNVECQKRIKVVDAFADLEPEEQERYMRRATALLPHIDEGKTGNDGMDAQAVAFSLFEVEKMPLRSVAVDYSGAVKAATPTP